LAYESVIHLDRQVKEEYVQVQVSLLEEIDVQASLLELAKERMDELQRVIAIRENEMGSLKECNSKLQA
jgi:hypothetical protein